MEFLTVDHAISIHALQLREFGGLDGIRDFGLLESAVFAPINHYNYVPDATIYDVATTYVYCISRNHPFLDGNKRTGLHCALTFLELNGTRVHTPERVLFQITYDLSTDERTKQEFAAYLAARLV
jgi:death on curing protein